MLNLLKHEIMSRRMGIIGWGIGLALFGSMYIAIYPEFSEQMGDLAELSIYEAMGIDMASFAGYIASVTIQYVPLLLSVYAIIASTGTLAGEEDNGTLEIVLAMPLYRWQVVTVKAIGIAVATFLIIVIAGIGDTLTLSIVKNQVEVDVTGVDLFIGTLNSWPIILAFTMIGLFFGAYLPNRRTAAGAITLIFIASYFIKVTADIVESLDFIRPVSLFHYFDTTTDIFTKGVQASDVLTLFAVAMVFFGLAVLSFQRRDVTVGLWPWQRAKVS